MTHTYDIHLIAITATTGARVPAGMLRAAGCTVVGAAGSMAAAAFAQDRNHIALAARGAA